MNPHDTLVSEADKLSPDLNFKLVFQNRAPHFRELILCKLQCPNNNHPNPHNICLISATSKRGDHAAPRNPNSNQAGWLSFTGGGEERMSNIGVTFPILGPTTPWIDCARYDGNEHGNRRRPGGAYDRGCDFGKATSALEWLINLLHRRGQTVCWCKVDNVYTDPWPEDLLKVLTAKGVGQCS